MLRMIVNRMSLRMDLFQALGDTHNSTMSGDWDWYRLTMGLRSSLGPELRPRLILTPVMFWPRLEAPTVTRLARPGWRAARDTMCRTMSSFGVYLPSWIHCGGALKSRHQTAVSVPLQGTGGVAPCPGARLPGDLDRYIHRSIHIYLPAHLVCQGDGAPPEEVLAAPRGAGRLGGAGEGEAALVQVGQLARRPARRAVWVYRRLPGAGDTSIH